jgi:hypothetical protein
MFRLSRLHQDEETLGEAGAPGQVAQGGPAFEAQRAHALAEPGEQPIRVHVDGIIIQRPRQDTHYSA